jgi:hypothetical protein
MSEAEQLFALASEAIALELQIVANNAATQKMILAFN